MHFLPHFLIVSAVLAAGLLAQAGVQSAAITEKPKAAVYEAKDFSHLLGMKGFSDTLLKNHFTLYQGYVKNTNLLLDKLGAMTPDGMDPIWAELQRRFAFEFDGMRLHELYFGNLGGKTQLDDKSALAKEIDKDFGSFDAWKKAFLATASMRGVGWAILYEDPSNGRLINSWIVEHQNSHLAGCQPILVLDVWEHAFMIDYQLDRKSYIQAFWDNIDWTTVAARYMQVKK